MKDVASQIEQAIFDCISNGECTADLGGSLSTSEAGAMVRERFAVSNQSRVANG
jgi:isocitrate/isopropylmalate dehydrogenase